jgi:Fe-S-cluster-containing hydrogenase component 2
VFNLLKVTFKPKIEDDQLRLIAGDCPTKVFEAGNRLFEEGDHGDVLYVLRAGTVNLLQGLQQQLVADQYAGELVGQLSLMGHPRRMYSALAMTRAECVEIDGQKFRALLSGNPEIRAALEKDLTVLLQETNTLYTHRASAAAMNFLMQNGLGEATDALIIDSSKCVGCDQCEVACASTHGGVSRLKRAQGPSLGRFHIPTACRHCETPHCMKDCPPDAIRRTQTGAVYIQDNCIGCGNCEANCPYGAIDLVAMSNQKNGLWNQLVTATQRFLPSNDIAPQEVPAIKLAVKCDACTTVAGGPACVRACPTGAALRLGSGELLEMIGE